MVIKGDLPAELKKLKQQNRKDLYVIGSGELVQTLMKHNLVDEYRLMHPIILGTGMHLFRDGSPKTSLKLTEIKTTTTGVVILNYKPEQIQNMSE